MPFQFTVADAKNSGALKSIAGVCSNSNAFLDLVNEVIRRLLKRGDWFGTTQVVEFCTTGCNITWPRWVGTIEGVRFGHSKPGHVFNNWYRFIGAHHRHSDFNSDVVLEDAGTAPCYNDVSGTTGKLIRYNVVQAADLGKKITLFGKRYGGQPLQENDPVTGLVVNGLTIAAANPYGTDATMVTQIEAITREATVGMAYLYEYDPVTQVVRDLARFDPNETNPRYRRSCIANAIHAHAHRDSNGVCWRQVEALIKLEFQAVVNDRDFLLIDDFDAIKLGIQAVKLEEANDDSQAEVKWLKAIRELNFRDRDKLPDDSTPVRVIAMDGHRIHNPR
jgi:hypothetical protein